jgi:hypothetical protein
LGREVVVTEGGGVTVKLRDWVVVTDLVSITCTVKVLVPVTLGVPEITPVLAAIVRPAGRVPEVIDQV